MVLSETCSCILDEEKRVLLDGLKRGINFQKNVKWDIESDPRYSKEEREAFFEVIDKQIESRQRVIDEIEKIKPC